MKANCVLKIIIFKYFAFLLELTFYYVLMIYLFCARLFRYARPSFKQMQRMNPN